MKTDINQETEPDKGFPFKGVIFKKELNIFAVLKSKREGY